MNGSAPFTPGVPCHPDCRIAEGWSSASGTDIVGAAALAGSAAAVAARVGYPYVTALDRDSAVRGASGGGAGDGGAAAGSSYLTHCAVSDAVRELANRFYEKDVPPVTTIRGAFKAHPIVCTAL